MSTTKTSQCEHCNKSSLSLLLLRPSPIAKAGPLVPPGSQAVQDAGALAVGLIPARAPTESRTVLRLLRAGFVHVYLPSPPQGMKKWLVYQITDNGDLIAQTNDAFNPAKPPASCARKEHNAAGMRLLSLPQAHKLGTIWLAYSANLWNDALKARNAGNPKVMQAVNLAGGSAHTFKPTAADLQGKVLECAVPYLSMDGARDHDFPFASLAAQAESLAQTMAQAAACHPKTAGKELAVVLGDPVGLATELNALRLRRHDLALREIEKPENAHPLNSSNAILGMRKSLLDAHLAESFEKVSPFKTRAAFEQTTWPAGTEWKALSAEERQALVKASSGTGAVNSWLLSPYRRVFESEEVGRVIYPDHDARAEAWAKEQVEATWSKIASRYDEAARARWVQEFDARMQAQHYEPLARFEADWRAAACDAATLAYFARHFDATAQDAPTLPLSSGLVYARESHAIHAPAPVTAGALRDDYVAMLDKPVSDEDAVVTRSIVGNQQSLFASLKDFLVALHAQATGDPGADGMRDKAYDFMKGLRSQSATLKKFGWMGDALCAFSVGQLSALSAAALAVAADSKALSLVHARVLTRLQALWGVQQAIEMAVQGGLSKGAPKVPVLLTMKVGVDEALAVLRARDAAGTRTSKNAVKRLRRGGSVQLTLLTDTDALRSAQGNVDALVKGPAGGAVSAGPAAGTTAAAAGAVAVLDKDQFLRLYAQQSKFGAKGAATVRQGLTQNASDLRAMTMTIDGRLAIGSIIVQGIGLVNGLGALADAKTRKDVRDAWYGIYDSTAGAIGGLLELWAVAVNVRTAAAAGAQGAAKSISLAALRFTANIAGAAGGAVNAVGAWAKEDDARARGEQKVAWLYLQSGRAFIGTSVAGTVVGVGVAADLIVARQVGGAVVQNVVRAVAVRVGAQGTAAVLGLSVSGWGLVLLGAGVLFQVGAIVMTPTPLQKWVGRSYFGKGDDKFVKGDWKAEKDALLAAVQSGTSESSQGDREKSAVGEPVAQ